MRRCVYIVPITHVYPIRLSYNYPDQQLQHCMKPQHDETWAQLFQRNGVGGAVVCTTPEIVAETAWVTPAECLYA